GAAAIELHFLFRERSKDDGCRAVAFHGVLKGEGAYLELGLAGQQRRHAALEKALAQTAGHRVMEVAHDDATLRLAIDIEFLQDARILRISQKLGDDRLLLRVGLRCCQQLQVFGEQRDHIDEKLPYVRERLDDAALPGLALNIAIEAWHQHISVSVVLEEERHERAEDAEDIVARQRVHCAEQECGDQPIELRGLERVAHPKNGWSLA